jgi:hypothetical protein
MNFKHLAIAGVLLSPFFAPAPAQASEPYCREYTKSIIVGGVRQSGYGTACYKPDGSWEIVDLEGQPQAQEAVHEYIRDDLYRRDNRVIVVDRYTPVNYYYAAPPRYYAPRPVVYYNTWSFGKHKRHDDRWDRRDDRRHDRHDRHDRHGHHDD